MLKICSKCDEAKELESFSNSASGRLGKQNYCKTCASLRHARFHQENKVSVNEASRARYYKNSELSRQASKDWKAANREKNRQTTNRWYRKKRSSDTLFRLKSNLRSRLNRAIKFNYRKGSSVGLLGCTVEEFKRYLETLFQPGMSWETWGRAGWHIDHVRPLSSFDLTDPQQLSEACNYRNLQPLWAKDNLSKGAKYVA